MLIFLYERNNNVSSNRGRTGSLRPFSLPFVHANHCWSHSATGHPFSKPTSSLIQRHSTDVISLNVSSERAKCFLRTSRERNKFARSLSKFVKCRKFRQCDGRVYLKILFARPFLYANVSTSVCFSNQIFIERDEIRLTAL